jgi:predicted outer membrane repeat protein
VTSSSFIHNTVTNVGGAIDNYGSSAVRDCTFTNNTSTYSGGAIYSNGNNITVNDSTFKDNTAKGITGITGISGGAICSTTKMTVIGSIFNGNTAPTGNGGAIDNYGPSTVTNCTFKNNIANLDNGGAIYNHDKLTVTNSIFTNNTAKNVGGAIFNYATLTVTDSTFTNNNAHVNGGAIENEGNLTVTGSTFISNNATDGGAIYNIGDAVAHFNQIVGNTAKIGNDIYNNPGGKVNAILNWWGFNLGVNIAKQIYNPANGTVNYNPWIILTITASPTSVNVGGNSTITAELLYSSNGSKVVYQNPKYGVVPYTGYADFKTNDGAIKNVKFVNGKATSTLTDLKTAGVAKVSATVDNLTLTKSVDVKTS